MTQSSPEPLEIQVYPATVERWADLEALFGPRVAKFGCWCTFWRLRRAQFSRMNDDQHKAVLKDMTERVVAPGLLAYVANQPIAWCSVGPREEFSPLEHSRTLKRVDDLPVWSIVCFYVARPFRRKGVMQQLLRAAVDYAGEQGAQVIVADPMDLQSQKLDEQTLHGNSGYMGIASVFRAVGFEVVGVASETQLILRYTAKDTI